MKLKVILSLLLFLAGSITAQKIKKVEPPNWWVGMEHNEIQLMIYGENLSNSEVKFDNHEIEIKQIHQAESDSYLFVDILIPNNLNPTDYNLILKNDENETSISFPIYKREKGKRFKGFNNSDVIYLLTPDRFANGNIENDVVEGYKNEYAPEDKLGRHGGDIQGIIDHLDYIKDLGATAVWINPLIENNTFISYHGYSATDFYNIDPRFGNNDLYKELVKKAHQMDLKIIYDHVSNHISIDHPWIKDLPFRNWINGTVNDHKSPFHHKMVFADPHSDSSSINHAIEGWFTDYMPDLNKRNEFLANYIIQNTIWWIEFSGLDGIREDTYPYNNPKFMAKWASEVLKEFPTLNILGEVWTGETAFLSTYQANNRYSNFNTNCPSITDFGLRDQLANFLQGNGSLYKIYNTLAKDFLFSDPDNLVTFIENHDIPRVMYLADGDFEKAKLALTILFTTRGIPQILYGSEIGKKGTPDHGVLRSDFPGGFPSSERNAFTKESRTDKENEIFNFYKKLISIRKSNKALQIGKLIQFPPENGLYYYFRKLKDEVFLVVLNESNNTKDFKLNRFSRIIGEKNSLIEISSQPNTKSPMDSGIKIKPMDSKIFRLIK